MLGNHTHVAQNNVLADAGFREVHVNNDANEGSNNPNYESFRHKTLRRLVMNDYFPNDLDGVVNLNHNTRNKIMNLFGVEGGFQAGDQIQVCRMRGLGATKRRTGSTNLMNVCNGTCGDDLLANITKLDVGDSQQVDNDGNTHDGIELLIARPLTITGNTKKPFNLCVQDEDFINNNTRSLARIKNDDPKYEGEFSNHCVFIGTVMAQRQKDKKDATQDLKDAKELNDPEAIKNARKNVNVKSNSYKTYFDHKNYKPRTGTPPHVDVLNRYQQYVDANAAGLGINANNGVNPEHLELFALSQNINLLVLKMDIRQWPFTYAGSFHKYVKFNYHHKSEDDNRLLVTLLLDKDEKHVTFVSNLNALLSDRKTIKSCAKCMVVWDPTKKSEHICGEQPRVTTTRRDLSDGGPFATKPLTWVKPDTKKFNARAKTLVVYDLETVTVDDDGKPIPHEPNCVHWTVWRLSDNGKSCSLVKKGDGDLRHFCGYTKEGYDEPPVDIIQRFVYEMTQNPLYKNAIVVAHNGSGYDNRFVLQHLRRSELEGSEITDLNYNDPLIFNGRIYNLHIHKNKLTFRDSYLHITEPLSKLPKMFGFPSEVKGDFPHKFNTNANLRKVIPISEIPLEMWDLENKSDSQAASIKAWYNEKCAENYVWDQTKELNEYCRQDVNILGQALVEYRKSFLDQNIDPLMFNTIASTCQVLYTNKFMPKNLIHQERGQHGESKAGERWICRMSNDDDRILARDCNICCTNARQGELLAEIGMPPCEKCGNGRMTVREVRRKDSKNKGKFYYSPCCQQEGSFCRFIDQGDENDTSEKMDKCKEIEKEHPTIRVNVDAYHKESQTVYRYHGCYYHGCPDCSKAPEIVGNIDGKKKTPQELYARVVAEEEALRENGYTVKTCWGCKDDTPAEYDKCRFSSREALSGGNTSMYKRYKEVFRKKGEYIEGADVCSLYPSVMTFNSFPTATPTVMLGKHFQKDQMQNENLNTFLLRKLKGETRVYIIKYDYTVLPNGPPIPTMTSHVNGKLMFTNLSKREVVKTSTDLLFELRRIDGTTRVDKIHAVAEYDAVDNMFTGYVNTFMRIKFVNGGVKTQEECDQWNEMNQYYGFQITNVTPQECVDNPGKKANAKLCLNNLWGKFCTRDDLPHRKTCRNEAELNEVLFQSHVENARIDYIDTHCDEEANTNRYWVEVAYRKSTPWDSVAKSTNCAIASFVTAGGRFVLHTAKTYLHTSQPLYGDTDSLFYHRDTNDPSHRHLTDDDAKERNITCGANQGGWEFEEPPPDENGKKANKDEWRIVGYACIQPKVYSLRWCKISSEYTDTPIFRDTTKLKGLRLSKHNKKEFTYEKMLAMAKYDKPTSSGCLEGKGVTLKGAGICDAKITTHIDKKLRASNDKRQSQPNGNTRPWEDLHVQAIYILMGNIKSLTLFAIRTWKKLFKHSPSLSGGKRKRQENPEGNKKVARLMATVPITTADFRHRINTRDIRYLLDNGLKAQYDTMKAANEYPILVY